MLTLCVLSDNACFSNVLEANAVGIDAGRIGDEDHFDGLSYLHGPHRIDLAAAFDKGRRREL